MPPDSYNSYGFADIRRCTYPSGRRLEDESDGVAYDDSGDAYDAVPMDDGHRQLAHTDPAYDANHDGWTDTCYNSCVSWCDSACGAFTGYTYSLPRTMPAQCQTLGAFFPGPSCSNLERSCTQDSDCKRAGFDAWAGTGCTGCAGGGCLANSGIDWYYFKCNLVGECVDDDCRRRRLSEEEAANASNTSAASSYADSDCCSCKPLAEEMRAKREERQRRERRRVEDES